MDLADLLAYSLMWSVESHTTAHDEAVCLQVFCWHSGHSDGKLLAFPDNDSVQGLVVIHDIEMRGAGDDLSIQRQENITLFQSIFQLDLQLDFQLESTYLGIRAHLDAFGGVFVSSSRVSL